MAKQACATYLTAPRFSTATPSSWPVMLTISGMTRGLDHRVGHLWPLRGVTSILAGPRRLRRRRFGLATRLLERPTPGSRPDAATHTLYVGYGAGALGLIDATRAQHLGDIPLQGHPEAFQLEQAGPRVFVNVPSAQHIAVVDRNTRAVMTTWPLQGATA